MIRLIHSPTFEQGVSITVPGKELPETVGFTFRALNDRQIRPLTIVLDARRGWFMRRMTFVAMCLRRRKWVTAVDLLDDLIVSWSGFDVEYSREHLRELLLGYPSAKSAIFLAYFDGRREARTKN